MNRIIMTFLDKTEICFRKLCCIKKECYLAIILEFEHMKKLDFVYFISLFYPFLFSGLNSPYPDFAFL